MLTDKQRGNLNFKSPRRVGKRERREREAILARKQAIDAMTADVDVDAVRLFYSNTGKSEKAAMQREKRRITPRHVVRDAHKVMKAAGTAKRSGKTNPRKAIPTKLNPKVSTVGT